MAATSCRSPTLPTSWTRRSRSCCRPMASPRIFTGQSRGRSGRPSGRRSPQRSRPACQLAPSR
eukprot:2371136-Alexandrium_andersonii.AAC.1